MAIVGQSRTFHSKYKFVVELDSGTNAAVTAGFQKCSQLEVEVAHTEYYEGGSLIPHKTPGRLKFADVTLERGATQETSLFEWFQLVADATLDGGKGNGLPDPFFKRNLDIVQLGRSGEELRRWRLSNAFPIKFKAGEWDNSSDEHVMESVTLAYDFFELKQAVGT